MERTLLAGIDVNLVVALSALLRERNVTHAARAVGLGQSSMSHALARLRAHFADPLLVPAGRELVLTERAAALVGPVSAAVRELEAVFSAPAPFEPRTAVRAFHLAAPDNLGLYLLPRLAKVLAEEAPKVDVRVHSLPVDWAADLAAGTLDLKLGRKYPIEGKYHSQDLLQERLCCVVRREHPLRRKPTLKQYAALSHVVVVPRQVAEPREEVKSLVDQALAEHGLERRIALSVPHFLVAPFVVAESDLVLTGPERTIARFVDPLRLRVLPLPLDLESYTLSQVWSTRSHHDPGHQWLRETIARIAG